ncbi:MAG: NERD domain-containing protein [Methylophilaceae bacterium]|nr:NERD domain-containing protein [Methylophilaceae bacterium]
MIVKENFNPVPKDRLRKAGHDEEIRVAYYLKMAFGDDPKVLILHDLRVVFDDGTTAQMDHLIIHQHGLIIVESKSVAGILEVEDDGQWLRKYSPKEKPEGMGNPIKQANRQGQTLKKVLLSGASNDVTRNAIQELAVDVLVTFSTANGGVFITKNRQLYPEVCPADVIDDHVNRIVSDRANNAKPQDFSLSESHRARLAEHLVKIHKPYKSNNAITENPCPKAPLYDKPLKVEQKTSEYMVSEKPKLTSVISVITDAISGTFSDTNNKFKHSCRKCKSDKVEIRFGKNYYLKCLSCDENNRIDTTCSKCKNVFKIRKDKKNFFAECLTCKTSEIFHINS